MDQKGDRHISKLSPPLKVKPKVNTDKSLKKKKLLSLEAKVIHYTVQSDMEDQTEPLQAWQYQTETHIEAHVMHHRTLIQNNTKYT